MSSTGADAAIVEGAQHPGGNPKAPLHGSPEISKSIRLPFLASSSHFQNFLYFFIILCCYSFPGDSGVDMFGCDGLMVRGPARRSTRRLRLGVVFVVVDGRRVSSLPNLSAPSELF
jgi:hypothetical protein